MEGSLPGRALPFGGGWNAIASLGAPMPRHRRRCETGGRTLVERAEPYRLDRSGLDEDVAGLDRVVDRVMTPFEPAAVVHGDPRPSHEVRVEPRLARPPARAAIEGDPLVGRDAGLRPVRGDLRVGTHRVVDRAVMLHVVRVTAAVAPDVAGDPSGRRDVVVAAALADVLVPGADADEGGALPVGEDLLRAVDVDDHLRA